MDLPDNVISQTIFIQGGAFYAQLTEQGDEYPRYYFVLNLNPQSDSLILLTSSTTRFSSHKNCPDADDVHINLFKKDYPSLKVDCIVCCNRRLKDVSKTNLIKQLKSQKYKFLEQLPQDLLQKILTGIAKSKVIPPIHKKMILPEENNIQ